MKTEVYSWRVSSELKADLEREARARKVPMSSILNQAVRDWLNHKVTDQSDEEEQRRLRAAMEACYGSISIGGGPYTADKVRKVIRKRLTRRYGR